MSKGGVLFFCILYLTIYSAVATASGLTASSIGSFENLTAPSDILSFLTMIGDFFVTMWNLITFNIVGFSPLVILFTIYPAIIGIIISIVLIARG